MKHSTRPIWLEILPGFVGMVILIASCALSGCATVSGTQEIAWQTLNVVDAGQTSTIARNPAKWMEVDPITRPMIGEHPTEKNVYLTMAAYAVVHVAVYSAFTRLDECYPDGYWGKALTVWESLTLTQKGFEVFRNNKYGIKPWGSEQK